MWGSAFSDLAKKAHDLQEQAKEQASHIAAPSFFNLDAMQQGGGQEGGGEEMLLFGTPQPSRHDHDVKREKDDDDLDEYIFSNNNKHDGDPFFAALPTMAVVKQKTKETMQTSTHDFVDKSAATTTKTEPPSLALDGTTFNVASTSEEQQQDGWEEEDDGLLEIVESNNSGENRIQVQNETTALLLDDDNDNVVLSEEETNGKHHAVDAGTDQNVDDSITKATVESSPIKEDVEETTIVEEATENSTRPHDAGIVQAVDKDSVPNDQLVESNIETNSVLVVGGDDDATIAANDGKEDGNANGATPRESKNVRDSVQHDICAETTTRVRETFLPSESRSSREQDVCASNRQDGEQLEIGSSPESQSADAADIDAVPECEDMVDAKHESTEQVEQEAEQVIVGKDEGSSSDNKAALADNNDDDDDDSHDLANDAVDPEQARGVQSANATKSMEVTPESFNIPVGGRDVNDETNEAPSLNETVADLSRASQTQQQQPQLLSHEYEQQVQQQLRNAHKAEIAKLKEQYENQMQEALDSFNHDACEAERREMEQRFLTQFRGKEEQVQELMRENEGCKLRIDALKREVEGTQALLEQRDSTMGSVNASHSKNIELLEQRIQELNNAKSLAKAETNRVKEELQATKTELSTSNEAYSSLKARVKVVATELKERRIECRSLAGTVAELKQSNEELETQVANLQSQLSDRDKSQTEKDKDVLKLREQVESLELELHKTKSELKDRDSVSEKALSSYKKKAQNALAVANARAAAANQAKEEAELEATTARTMSEEAIQRATITENAGKKALAEAKEYVREMESEKEGLEKKLSQVCESLETIRAESEHLKNCLDASRVAQEKLAEDLKLITRDREEERGKNRELQRQLAENQQKLELLYEEVETLREDLRQANATVAASSSNDNSEKESRPTVWTHTTRASDELPDRSDAEGTIAMLEGDLRDANRAIKELKDALKNAIAVHGSNGYGNGMQPGHYHGNPQHASAADTAGNESTPLFYAMEKQAELNTARDEINRLANLLGDAESAKMEAFEAMDEMRRRMEEAEARLNRQEKFEGASRPTAAASTTAPSANDNANLEYLKNIMLSYLNAKSLTEKKALVPVIAAVLCLTPEEQATAVKNIDESGGLEVVGRTLFESLGGSLGR